MLQPGDTVQLPPDEGGELTPEQEIAAWCHQWLNADRKTRRQLSKSELCSVVYTAIGMIDHLYRKLQEGEDG